MFNVAPFVGAWIETPVSGSVLTVYTVAPFVGAWIETINGYIVHQLGGSLPSWERGLKPFPLLQLLDRVRSLPSWERGLKPSIPAAAEGSRSVAPFVGAWIETMKYFGRLTPFVSLPSWERGLKHS